ncbi:MAG: hypothetical protein NTY06_03330, partial [Candidatus Gottesmanbacteria bacterium]|nr:hypothetical protein [Candidatus Gottesmanbacteria bacterium]
GSLLMIDTHLHPVSVDTLRNHVGEEVFVISMGGTKAEGVWIKINDHAEPEVIADPDTGLPLYTSGKLSKKEYSSPEELFAEVLRHVDAYAKDRPIKNLAFNFGYRGTTEDTRFGIDVISPDDQTKGFRFHGISKRPIGESLVSYMVGTKQYHIDSFESLVVLNDTPSVLLALRKAKLGGIIGTGYNFAIMINGVIYNIEAGGFSSVPQHTLSRALDFNNPNKSDQLAEKQISGLYLGMQMEFAIRALDLDGIINARIIPRPADEEEKSLPAEAISHILERKQKNIAILKEKFIEGDVEQAIPYLLPIAERLRDRSAQLVGTKLAAAINTFPAEFPDTDVLVPVAGAVVQYMPHHKDKAEQIASQRSEKHVSIQVTDFAEAKGAAAAVFGVKR